MSANSTIHLIHGWVFIHWPARDYNLNSPLPQSTPIDFGDTSWYMRVTSQVRRFTKCLALSFCPWNGFSFVCLAPPI